MEFYPRDKTQKSKLKLLSPDASIFFAPDGFLVNNVSFFVLTRCCSAHLWCHKASPRECSLGNKDARWSFSSSPPWKRGNDLNKKRGFFDKPVPATCSSPRSGLLAWGKFLRRWEPSLSRASYSPCSTRLQIQSNFDRNWMEIQLKSNGNTNQIEWKYNSN